MAEDRRMIGDLILGDHDCPKSDVLAAITRSASFGRLLDEWGSLATHLELTEYKIMELADGFVMKVRIKTLPQLVDKLLAIWKAEKGDQAKLVNLCDAFLKCGLTDIAEALSKQFENSEQPQVNQKFIWQGKLLTADELLPKDQPENFADVKNKSEKLSQSQALPIIRPEINPPDQPKYYVPRTLSYIASNELDPEIFTSESTTDHVFLFSDMEKPELAKLTQYKYPIEYSGNQLYKLTVKFILLECVDDFDWICQNTTKPIHMIQLKKGRYFWVKSNTYLDLIRQYLKEPAKDISEEELESRIISLPPPCALSIADSPGMGKTLVLANLARTIYEQCTIKTIHLFIVLQEFMQQIQSFDSSSSALETIAEYSSSDQVTGRLLCRMMKESKYQIYLFLDAYDEVPQDKLDLVDSFLEYVQELQNFKVIVTTRPHMKLRLEAICNQFSYEIHPFTVPNQVSFLTRYWINQHRAENCGQLEKFARQSLQALQKNISDGEREIAGIPLICMMLGEVFAKEAKRACQLKCLRPNSATSIAFIHLYKKLIELKINRIPEGISRKIYSYAHINEAIKLLFPGWTDIFKSILRISDEFDETTMYSIGLVEKGPNAPRFVHRTFAEYLLAEFCVDNLGKRMECVELLFGDIFGRKGTVDKYSEVKDQLQIYNLKYPVIAYFIDMHLKERSIDELLLPDYQNRPSPRLKINEQKFCLTLRACCSNELESVFNYTTKLLKHIQVPIGKILRDHFIKDLPHVVAKFCRNVEMLENVVEFANQHFQVDINYYVKNNYQMGNRMYINYCTPLHVAVHEGKYNMVTSLVQRYGDRVKELQYLVHACVFWSSRDSNSVVEDKLLILNMLASINRCWIDEEKEDKFICVPLLQFNVHINLLKCLVCNGADINAYSSKYGTVLHQAATKATYKELVRWAFSSGFKLQNCGDYDKRTPLMCALQKFGVMEDDVLNMFIDAGADFNVEDKNGDSVLFYALQYSGDVRFIKKLIERGADVNHKNYKNQNALHIIMQAWKGSTEDTLETLDMLVDINRGWINEKDRGGCTPLLVRGILLQAQHNDFRLLQRLVEHGADINAYSSYHGTVLHGFSYSKHTYTDLVRWAFLNGFKLVNHKDRYNRNPLMHAIKHFETVDYDDEVFQLFLEAGSDLHTQDAEPEFLPLKVQTVSLENLKEKWMSMRQGQWVDPLNEGIQFLAQNWAIQHGAEHLNILTKFAEKIILSLKRNMSDREKKIAESPLLCMMLLEVFAEGEMCLSSDISASIFSPTNNSHSGVQKAD